VKEFWKLVYICRSYYHTCGLPGRRPAGKSNRRPTLHTSLCLCPRRLGSVWDGPAWKATGHDSRQARNWHVPLSLHRPAQASARTRTAAIVHCTPACVARGDLLRVGNFALFFEILHIKGRNFPEFHGNRSASFSEIQNTDTHRQTDAANLYIYKVKCSFFETHCTCTLTESGVSNACM